LRGISRSEDTVPVAGDTLISGEAMAAIDQIRSTIEQCDEQAARRTLRGQIARLEREHASLVAHDPGPPERSALTGPRLLTLGELERVRDALAARVVAMRTGADAQAARQAIAERELEAMYADPPAHKWKRLTHADLGIPGCGDYHVRPRAGLLGMLMGWWQVKVSSGCPLAIGIVAEGGRRQADACQAKPF
jgi:hypothetical protein